MNRELQRRLQRVEQKVAERESVKDKTFLWDCGDGHTMLVAKDSLLAEMLKIQPNLYGEGGKAVG